MLNYNEIYLLIRIIVKIINIFNHATIYIHEICKFAFHSTIGGIYGTHVLGFF